MVVIVIFEKKYIVMKSFLNSIVLFYGNYIEVIYNTLCLSNNIYIYDLK